MSSNVVKPEKEAIKIAFISLGCDKNLVDSEVMLGIIRREGYQIIPDEEDADVIIVNTCGFILEATDEGIQNVLKAAEYKQDKCRALIVTGCMAQRYKDEIFEEIPEVDAVVGTGDYEKIHEAIEKTLAGDRHVALVTDINNVISEEHSMHRILSTPSYFAYMKIAEGCDNFCTYCTIPSLRGKYRSRSMESLIAEGQVLADQGVKELILVAQDTALYGKDLYGKSVLHELLAKLSEIEGVAWIRILYCYPEHITDETIEEMARNPKVCHYLDMPIQHSHDAVLKRMGRRSDEKTLRAIIGKLRQAMPDIALRTTLIVGFPGETKAQFEALVRFVEEVRFDRLGVFAYSREEGTPAHDMADQIDDEEKQRRKAYILDIQKKISAEKCGGLVGETLQCIVEGRLAEDGENVYCARSFMDCYEIDGMVFFSSDEEIISGEFRDIHITESSDYDLIGEVVYESAQ